MVNMPVKPLRLWEQDEPFLHSHFYQMMSPDFYTAHEVKGQCNVNHPSLDQAKIRCDFLCYPKPHVVKAGFAQTWFAVEIKANKGHYLEKGLRQAFWYTLATFTVKDRIIAPAFSCLWMPEIPEKFQAVNQPEHHQQEIRNNSRHRAGGIKHMMAYLNAGTIRIGDSLDSLDVWDIFFHDRYASRSNRFNGDGEIAGVHVSQNLPGFKLRIGNKPGTINHSGMMGVSA